MKKALTFAAFAEALTALALLIVPSLVGRLLLGEELTGVAIPVARVTGFALIGLAVACWPEAGDASACQIGGMGTYGLLVTLYLAWRGLTAERTGLLLWPAVALHAGLTLALMYDYIRSNPKRI